MDYFHDYVKNNLQCFTCCRMMASYTNKLELTQMDTSSKVQVDFGHRSVTVTVAQLRKWGAPGATIADLRDACKAFGLKDTPAILGAVRQLVNDIATQTPGAHLFPCTCCGADTYGAPGVIGPELCQPCYELAGLDNELNDNGCPPDGWDTSEAEAWLASIRKAGGDTDRVRASNPYIWPAG